MTIKHFRNLASSCTALALCSPAMAHEDAHEFSFLTSLLHELSHTDYVVGGLAAVAALGAGAAWGLARRRRSRSRL
ncbi:MAG: hypothetical protein ABWY05_09910 [Noviherbaspirillum sp.]